MSLNLKKGFTLVELLIVIAILGTLAVVVLIALNPVQQLARTRDSGRISGVTQLGHAVEAWSTVNNGIFPLADGSNCPGGGSGSWAECLTDSGEINTIPSEIVDNVGAGPCTAGAESNTWCYATGSVGGNLAAVVFAQLEAQANIQKCGGTGDPYAVYSTADGRAGIVCLGAEPTPGPQTWVP